MTITTFASGELSPNLKGRVDLPQYFSGAQKIQNFEIIPTGGIMRRKGFKRLGKLHGRSRLIPFIVNKYKSFVLEFIPGTLEEKGKIYFWEDGRCKKTLSGTDFYIETEYRSIAEINEVQYAQNYDRLIFVHKKHKPLEVVYNMAQDTFTSEPFKLEYYVEPYLDDDYGFIQKIPKDEVLPPSAEIGSYALYRGHLYKRVSDGDTPKWELQGDDPSSDTGLWQDTNEDNEGKYPGCVTFFQNRLYFASTENHPQRVWASAAPDTDGMRYRNFGSYQKYVTTNKTIKDPDIHLFTCDIFKSNVDTEHKETLLTNVSQDLTERLKESPEKYFVLNNTYAPAGSNTKVVEIGVNTIKINQALTLEDDVHAIVFELSLWQDTESATAEDYETIVVNNNTVTSDVSFYFEPASDQNDAIKWLAPAAFLAMGTESNVWNIPSGVNALNVQAIMNGRYGSDDIQAHVLDTAVIFFAQGNKGIREYYYNAQSEAFTTNNIAVLADHLLKESPAMDFDFVTNPYNRLIITRADGTAATLLYDKNNGVMGWNRIVHGEGKLKSCAVTRGDDFCDIIFYEVQYGEDNAAEYYLEMLDDEQEIYLDSWKEYTEEVESEYDMEKVETYDDGQHVYIGYPFRSVILSMPVVTQDISQKKRIVNLYVRFNESYMPVMKTTNMPDEHFNGVTEPYSGVRKIDYPGASDIDVTFELEISNPVPCNILSVDASLT